MKSDRTVVQGVNGKVKRARAAKPKAEPDCEPLLISVERSGDWMPAEELLATAQTALDEDKDVSFNLDRIDHLDASALQIMLALEAEQKKRNRHLLIVNASPNLQHWFEYSGATGHFFMTESKKQ
jgi:anti-anti-sigma regulatory factor